MCLRVTALHSLRIATIPSALCWEFMCTCQFFFSRSQHTSSLQRHKESWSPLTGEWKAKLSMADQWGLGMLTQCQKEEQCLERENATPRGCRRPPNYWPIAAFLSLHYKAETHNTCTFSCKSHSYSKPRNNPHKPPYCQHFVGDIQEHTGKCSFASFKWIKVPCRQHNRSTLKRERETAKEQSFCS